MEIATKFQKNADKTIAHICDIYELRDNLNVDMENDILTIETSSGKYVINKHAPTMQIWVSSPLSGAHHFFYSEGDDSWINTRDSNMELFEILKQEIR